MHMRKLTLGASLVACSVALASWLSTYSWVALLAFFVSVMTAIFVQRLSATLSLAEGALVAAQAEAEDLLGVQRHALGNRLQVILGLIQLGKSERAQEYIKGLDLTATLSRKAKGTEPHGQS